jgi:2,4-dienoyl-CoA reductase-like NADH-dependent reductase (Old Yellow Enzyme family)
MTSNGAADARPLLFTPIKLRGVTARNRIVVSPMCQYVSVDGGPTDWQFVHFGRYAMGGAGIVFGEESAVEARGRKTYHCAGIWNDHQARAYRRVTDFIKQMGAVPAIQLGHCGRNAGSHGAMEDWRALDERDARAGMPPWRGLAPSPLPARRGFPVPIEMDHDDIRTVLSAFRDATHRATDAGYDIAEIHGAHG